MSAGRLSALLKLAFFISFLLLFISAVGTATASGEWVTYQADDLATGYVSDEPITENLTEEWRYDTEFGILSSPAVTEERVYVGKLRSGNLREYSPQRRDISVEANETGWLTSFNRETGEVDWQISTNGSIVWSSPAVSDETVYIATLAGTVYAVNSTDGDIRWEFDVDYQFFASPRVVDGTVYIGSRDFSGHSLSHREYPMYALDADDGTVEWVFDIEEGVFGAAAVAEDSVYVGGQNGSVFRLDADTGELLWEFETDELPDGSSMWRRNSAGARNGGVPSGPTVADGTVYFGSYAGYVYAVDAETGTENWSYHVDAPFVTSPAVHDGTVYIGGYDTNLHAIDAETGEREWRYFAEWEMAKSSPIIVGDTVYVGTIDGNFYAVDSDTGEEVWKYPTETYIDSAAAYYNGTLYLNSFRAVHAIEENGDGELIDDVEYGGSGEIDTDGDESSSESSEPEGGDEGFEIPFQTKFILGLVGLWITGTAIALGRSW